MKLWKVRSLETLGWDTYDSFIVASETEELAENIHPEGGSLKPEDNWDCWVNSTKEVTVEYIGEAKEGIVEGTIILASFNAG